MALQSQAPRSAVPHVLLTRPAAQSRRFARRLRAAFANPLQIMIAPLMAPRFLVPTLLDVPPEGLIFSSETAVAAYLRLGNPPRAPVWCVGRRTAHAAETAGLETVLVTSDAARLLTAMVATRPRGPFLHLRGQVSTGNLAVSLTEAGILTSEAIVYDQRPLPLQPRAMRLLQGPDPVIVPVFSARSMRLFCAEAPAGASLRLAALSPAVAAAAVPFLQGRTTVSETPDAESLLKTVLSLLREPALP